VSNLTDGLRLAVGTLTVVPVPPPRSVGRRAAAVAMLFAPAAVLPVAAVAAGVVWAADAADASPLLGSVLAVAALALGSGVLHLDGLADTADGMAVPGDRQRRLEVMRRGDVGPAGAVALVAVLLIDVSALSGLLAREDAATVALTFGLAVLASRATLGITCARGVPAARGDGLGRGVAGTVPVAGAVAVLAMVAVLAGLADGWHGVAGVGSAVVAVGVVVLVARRRLGGVTGDVLGAGVEVALAAYLVAQVLSI